MTNQKRRLAAILCADVVGYSRLMGDDEEATVAVLVDCREVFSECVENHDGRVVDTTGDSVLSVFDSVVEAVRCAMEIQIALSERNEKLSEDRKMRFRIGINLGDIIEKEDGTVYGDGVNVAARMEALTEPGGVTLSDDAYRQVRAKLQLTFEDMGDQQVKNIARPVRVYRIKLDEDGGRHEVPGVDPSTKQQEIRFCTASDGVRIAYATSGKGLPLVKAANWLNHLEYDWQSPVWRHLLQELTKDHSLIRYDERGNGLSDWDVADISFDAFVRDLETVIDAAGLDRFALLGISQGCAVSVAYAVRHPERVTHLVLYGGYARGARKRASPEAIEQAEAMLTLMRHGWGSENAAFRQIFTSRFIPEATAEQMQWFNDLRRITASPENAVRIRQVIDDIDVDLLLSQVTVPTVVLHCRDDAAVPFEEGRRMASLIPRARFVALEGRNHLILEDELALPRFLEEVRAFLA